MRGKHTYKNTNKITGRALSLTGRVIVYLGKVALDITSQSAN